MKKVRFKLIILSIFCLSCIAPSQRSHAQQPQGLSDYDIATKSTSFYPVSVSASQLFRKIPEQIDYATGRATIRIPVYEIKTADLTLPISLYYVTSGIKVGQVNGTVGLGWQMEAEPMVTRQVRGLPDEDYFLQDASAHRNNSESYRLRLATGRADLQEDLFYYRLLGTGGKFVLQESDNRSFLLRPLTTSSTRISSNGPITATFHNPLYITDPSGNRYVFGGEESSREMTFQNNRLCVTSWKASEIVSPSGDKISFGYGNITNEYSKCDYDFYTLEDGFPQNIYSSEAIPPHPGYWKGVNGKMNYYYLKRMETDANGNEIPVIEKWDKVSNKLYSIPGSRVEARPLKTITFAGGKVSFYYNTSSSMLERIEVTDSDSRLIKKVVLKTRQHAMMNKYYLLEEVEVCGTDSNVLERYRLDYNSGSFWEEEKGVDYWGYYNGNRENTDLVARQTAPLNLSNGNPPLSISIGGAADKGSNYLSSVFMLSKITYPSGGSTEYAYETNSVHLPQSFSGSGASSIYGGGPRLRAMVETPKTGNEIVRNFYYGSDENFDGIGYARFPVCPDAFRLSLNKHYIIPGKYTINVYSGNSRTYSNMDTRSSDMGVYYPCVGEMVNGLLSVHYFNNRLSLPCGENSYPLEPLDNGELLAREDSSSNYYKDIRLSSTSIRMKGAYNTVAHIKPYSTFESPYDPFTSQLPLSIRQLYLNSYHLETRTVVANEEGREMTETISLHNGVPHRRTEHRDYLAGTRLLRRIRTDNETVEFSYPSDKAGSAYSQMVSRNVLDTPVETRHYIDGALHKQIRYNYRYDPSVNSGYSLSSIEENMDDTGTAFREVESYSDYLPCGKPCQLIRVDGTVVTFVWSYGGARLIAAVEAMYSSTLRASGVDLNSISDLQTVPESVYSRLDALRGSHPEARVTTYRYLPLTGLTRITAPDGTATHYRYDTGGRLSEVLDNQLHQQSTYEYHEANK